MYIMETQIADAMAMSHVEQTAYFALLRAGRTLATPSALAQILAVTTPRATQILHKLKTKGAARKAGKGLYALLAPEALKGAGQFIQDPLLMVAQLMAITRKDYAAAYLSAAYIHGFLEQIPQSTQVMITHYRRPIRLSPIQLIRFIRVSPWKFLGTAQTRYAGDVVLVTDPEKTVLDCLDRMDLAGGLDQAAQILAAAAAQLDARKLVHYAKQMKNRSLIQRLGYLLEKAKLLPEVAASLQPMKHPVPCRLDPGSPWQGKRNDRWQVMENSKISWKP